jgi:hypothetical protein
MASNFTPGNGFAIELTLDDASLATLHSFENYEAVLEPALSKAMDAGISMIQAGATDFMWSHFRNPTGGMENAWDTEMQSPYLAILSNTAPYAQRRNYGFSNMRDSLGRYYAHDPGIGWAETTLVLEQYKVEAVFQAAIDYANLQLGRIAV